MTHPAAAPVPAVRVANLMNRIADLQERLGVGFRLRGFNKDELFTDDQAAAMRRAPIPCSRRSAPMVRSDASTLNLPVWFVV